MKINELDSHWEQLIANLEKFLDDRVYQPPEKVKNWKPGADAVLDLELPSGEAHFMNRIKQRAKAQNITPKEIAQVLANAKLKPQMGVKSQIEDLSKETYPKQDIFIQDPETKLTIPAIIKPNPECDPKSFRDDIPICLTKGGALAPKNQMVAKTIYRKGFTDDGKTILNPRKK